MNPMFQEAVASVVRWVLAIGAGYLVKVGIWTDNDAANYVAAGALALTALAWSLVQKYRSRQKLQMALASGSKQSEAQVEKKLAAGVPVSVTTSKDVTPSLSKE